MAHGSASLVYAAALWLPVTLCARGQELARQGQWTVDAPQGSCGSLPLLQVKGPGTLFDGSNAAALAALQAALSTALARSCPGVTEAILVNGRARKLVRLPAVAQDSAGQGTPAVYAGVTTSGPERTPLPRPGVVAAGNIAPPVAPERRSSAAVKPPAGTNFEVPPHFPTQRAFTSLSSVRGTREKCDVLFAWLESGKGAAAPGRRVGTILPAQMMEIFQDGAMTAVFGKPYDALANSTRIDLYEKTFGACTGEARRTPQRSPVNNGRPVIVGGVRIPLGGLGGINLGQEVPLPAEYRQQFAQYSQLLHQAFGGSPGSYEPATVTAYVLQVRTASVWANETATEASTAQSSLEAFHRMQAADGAIGQEASQLTAADRDSIRQYLRRRETAMAPLITRIWLASQGGGAGDLTTARALVSSRAEMGGVLAVLSPEERKQTDEAYSALLDRSVAPSLESASAPWAALPATWQGALALAGQEKTFLADLGLFSGVPSYRAATGKLDAARMRIYTSVLPEWRRKVNTAHTPEGELLARREDLRTLFVTPADRQLPLFQQFEEPVKQRQAQFDAAVQADEQRRLAEAERAAADEASRASGEVPKPAPAVAPTTHSDTAVPTRTAGAHSGSNPTPPSGLSSPAGRGALQASDLKVGSGTNAALLTAIYVGGFDKIKIDRASTALSALGNGYIEGYFESCKDFLPPHPVELMTTECAEVWVNRYGVEGSCASYRPKRTGIYADPKLYAALNSAPIQQVSSALRSLTDLMTSDNPFTAGVGMVLDTVQMKADASQVVAQTGCTSPALKHFQINLERFALGQGGIRLNGTVELGVALLPPPPGTKYRDSDYGRLLDDMVGQQSITWAANRYRAGSVSGARVTKRDTMGRPATVDAGYAYSSFFGKEQQSGAVTLQFDDGRPHCLYFSDQPSACRTPSNALTAAYIRGEYR